MDGEIKKPRFCTIDEEKNVILFKCGTIYEEPDKIYFTLVWKNRVVSICLRQNVTNANTTIWELLSISIPKDLEVYKDEIIADLRDAIKVYGFNGDIPYLWNNNNSYHKRDRNIIINF